MARSRRLEGHAPVQLAIRAPFDGPLATEAEVGVPRLADRPAAIVLLELEQRLLSRLGLPGLSQCRAHASPGARPRATSPRARNRLSFGLIHQLPRWCARPRRAFPALGDGRSPHGARVTYNTPGEHRSGQLQPGEEAVSRDRPQHAPAPPRALPRFASEEQAADAARAFDLRSLPPDYYANPYPYYHALRDRSPVHRLPDGGYFLAELRRLRRRLQGRGSLLLRQEARVQAQVRRRAALRAPHDEPRLQRSSPAHPGAADHRRRLHARSVADMEEPVTRLVDALIDRIAATGAADLIADLAAAVPVEVIGNLLAVPREERGPLRDWSLAILGALEPVLTPEQQQRGEEAVAGFLAYLRTLVARRRARPGDPDRDVLTRLIGGEEDGERLSEHELLHNIVFILNAGHETTTNLVGNGLFALLEWPEERARLIARPDLIRPAVEEVLRFESPNQLGNRLATRDVRSRASRYQRAPI